MVEWFPQRVGFINIKAPVLDAYVGLLEPPEYILYLGDRAEAADRIKQHAPKTSIVMPLRQFRNERLGGKYNKCKGHIDVNNAYRFKLGKYSPS